MTTQSGPEVVGTPRLDEMLGHLIRRTQQLHTLRWAQELNGDLTGPQYALLSAINSRPQLDQKSAGVLASLDKSTAADVITRLERNGWIRRQRAADDARRSVLTLTAPTRNALAEVTEAVRRVQAGMIGVLSETEREEFVRLLAKVAYAGEVPIADAKAPSWGDELVLSLSRTPGHLLRRAEQVHQKLWAAKVGSMITPSQYALLTALAWQAEDQTAAGARASLDKSSVADIVQRLRKRGLIGTQFDDVDRRRKVVSLTPSAITLLAEATPRVREVQEDLLAPLDPRFHGQLIELLKRVAYQAT